MFKGGISFDAPKELVVTIPRPTIIAQRYVMEVLQDHVVPFAPFIGATLLRIY